MHAKPPKILIISDAANKPKAIYIDQIPKLAKGFIRLGHDVRCLNYNGILSELSVFKSRSVSRFLYKNKADEMICCYAKHYMPDIIIIAFPRVFNKVSIERLKEQSPSSVFVGIDGDLWPGRNLGRIGVAKALDILLATNNGSSLDEYRQAGVKKCVFIPNTCDPDIQYRYSVDSGRECNILWTGKVQHNAGGDSLRKDILCVLSNRDDARLYGCLDQPQVGGIDYLYAISGARIGISINADNTIPLYHSDRFTHYAACGTMVLAKRVPQTEHLMENKKHVVYFDTVQECMELADWYLAHESERQKIADAGMERCHALFNAVKIAGYMLDVVDTGEYNSPWGVFS